MSRIININSINPITFEYQTYSIEDNSLIFNTNVDSVFNPTLDIIEYFVYDLNNQIVYSNVTGYPGYSINDKNVVLDPEKDLVSQGFTIGQYNTVYNFVSPKLASNSTNPYFISQISSDRTEVRLDTTAIANDLVIASSLELINDINSASADYYDFYLDFGDNELVIALNALLDTTDSNNPTVLIKLYEPLPQQFNVNSQLWVVTQVAEPIAYNIDINETFDVLDNTIIISGPNYNLNVNDQINNSTNYISYNNLTSTSASYSQGTGSLKYQLNNILAQTGIDINIDYSNYSDFVHFSSAQTRLENFYYKLSLLGQYQYSASFSNNSSSGSYYVSSSNIIWQSKINEVITTFDDYEYYLYYSSGSTAWPKTNTAPPYINASTSSVAGQNWFVSQSAVAELYDLENNNALTLAIPSYITDDSDNTQFELFVEMVGQLFDNIFVYLQNITTKNDADNRLTYGVSKDLVADILRDMGITIYQNNFSSNDVYQALIGLTPSGSLYNLPFTTTQYPVPTGSFLEYITTYVTASSTASLYPTDDINKEQYKRIYHNLPLLLKKKGSVAGLRDLITTFGVTDTILRINEFGGKDRNINSYDNWQDEYNYAFYTSGSSYISSSFVLNSSWGATNNKPTTVEFRFKTDGLPFNTASIASQSLWLTDTGVNLKLRYTGSGYTSGSYSGSIVNPYYQYALLDFIPSTASIATSASLYLPFYDGGWWSVLINSSSAGFTLYSANKNYNGEDGNTIGFQASASVTGGNVWTASLVSTFGSASYKIFTGSFQEIRYYTQPITNDNFNAYVMNPYSIESSENLAFRASLGGELYTSSISIHPKVTGSWAATSSFASNSNFYLSGSYAWAPNTEVFYFDQVPAGIQNPISQKIKQQSIILPYSSSDANIPNANILSPYRSIQQFPAISSSYTRDIDYVEVGFSPQNEINQDINSQLGYFNLGDVIGDPRFQSSSLETYPALDAIRESYFQKYTKNYQEFDYIRLIEFFDNSLFKIVQDWSPARTSLAAGIIIKNTLLDRNRYPVPQVSPSASIAFIGSGSSSIGIPYTVEDQTITGSIESGFITGSEGGSMPELFGQTSSILAYPNAVNITQSWNGVTPSLYGLVPFTQSSQTEFFNGQLSGSNLVVTTGDLSDCNVEIVQVGTYLDSTYITVGANSIQPILYDFDIDFTYYLSFQYQLADSTTITLKDNTGTIYFTDSNSTGITVVRNVYQLEVNNPVVQLGWIKTGSNSVGAGFVTIYESYIEPDCLVVQNDAQVNRPSYKYMGVDFSNNQIIAVNEQSILSGSATRAAVPDSYYTSAKQINSRYIGKELVVSNLNKWTQGDISYGKSVTVGNPEVNFVYFNNVGSTSPEWGNNLSSKTQANIRLIVNDSGSVTKPINDAEGINLGTIQQSFVDSGNATLILDDYDTFGVNLNNLNGTWPIFKSGVSIAPILYTQTASYNANGDIIGYGYTSSITFNQGQQGSDIAKNDYQLLTYGVNNNIIDSNTSIPYTLNFSKPIILGNSGSFNTGSDSYNPTGSVGSLLGLGYILYFQAHIEDLNYPDATVTYAIQKNGVTVNQKQINHATSASIDIYFTETNATTASLYTIKAITYQDNNNTDPDGNDLPSIVYLNASSYFKVTQYPLPGTGICTSFWSTGSNGTTSYPNVLLANTASNGLNQYVGQMQKSIERSGFNPISLDFEPQPYDEIRFQGIENLAFGVTSVTPTILNTTASAAFDVTYAWNDYLNIGYGAFSVNGVRFNVTNSQYVDSPTDIYLAAPFFATQSATNLAVTASTTLNTFNQQSYYINTLGLISASASGSNLQLFTTSSLLGLPFASAYQLNNYTYISGSTTYNFTGSTDYGQVGLILDGNIPNGTNLSYFLLRRYVNDPSNIILDLDKPAGASSGGVLKPEYVTDNLNKNLDSILQNLKSKGLI